MPPWLTALESSPLTAFLRDSSWAVPTLEIFHLVGLVMVIGGAAGFDLKLLGKWEAGEIKELSRSLLPWAWAGLFFSAVSGVVLFVESPIELYLNPAFRVKLGLLALSGLNVWVFHRWVYSRLEGSRRAAQASAWVSLTVWFTVLVFGHLIAYV